MPVTEFQQVTLQECMHQQGCPLCRAVWKIDGMRFGWYVNDGVLDEETQRDVVRAIGFCAPHALYLSLIEGSDFLWSHLGSCMVYIHVIEYALLPDLERFLQGRGQRLLQPLRRKVFSPLRHLFHHDLCLPCFDHRQHETAYREQFTKAISTNEDFRQAYLQADSLCLPHFQQVRSALAKSRWVQMLEVAEFHRLKQYEQIQSRLSPPDLKRYLGFLYGGETFLWSDFFPRAAVRSFEVNPLACLACQQREQEATQMMTVLLDHLEETLHRGWNGEQGPLCLCSWHAWWLFKQITLQSSAASRVEPLLRSTGKGLLSHPGNIERQGQACHICEWVSEQETLQVESLQHQLLNPQKRVQLCLPHARSALRRSRDEETLQAVTLALLRSVSQVGRGLKGYVHNCTERYQSQMRQEEQFAWFDAIRWFGGSESAQFLLTSSPATETSS